MILEKIGMITIGQSPRIDIIPEMREVLGRDVEILEAGALDGLALEEVKKFYPKGRDYILCTRMSDGTEVIVAKRFIVPRVQKCIDFLIGDERLTVRPLSVEFGLLGVSQGYPVGD